MDEAERKVLRTNYSLLQDILMTPELTGEFYSRGLLTEEIKDRLQGERDRVKIIKFVDILPQRGPKAFNRFVDVIRRDYSWIAETLEKDVKKMKDRDSGTETVQKKESETEVGDDYENTQASLPLFAKYQLLEQWKNLLEHLKDHRDVITDEKNISTIRLDDVGNLIKMMVQICKKKREYYKQKLSKQATEKEEMKSKIKELTKENEEINRKLSIAHNELEVSDFHLKHVKDQLNKSNQEIAELKATLSVSPNPEQNVVGRVSRESTMLSLNLSLRGEAALGNYKQPQISPCDEECENLAEKANENSAQEQKSTLIVHEENPDPEVIPEIIDDQNNNYQPAKSKTEDVNVIMKAMTCETARTTKVIPVSDKLTKPSIPGFPMNWNPPKYGRGRDQNANVTSGAYQLRKGPQQQSVTRNQRYRDKNQNVQRKQMQGNSLIPETKKYQNFRDTARSRLY